MRWLSLQDNELPTWAHTALTLAIASAFAVPLLWSGFHAIATGYLEPMMGPDFGTWWFSDKTLIGRAAVIGGCALFDAGLMFLSIGVAFSRWAEGRTALRLLPWFLFAISVALHFWTISVK